MTTTDIKELKQMMSTVIAKYERFALFIIGDNIGESSANSTKRTEGH